MGAPEAQRRRQRPCGVPIATEVVLRLRGWPVAATLCGHVFVSLAEGCLCGLESRDCSPRRLLDEIIQGLRMKQRPPLAGNVHSRHVLLSIGSRLLRQGLSQITRSPSAPTASWKLGPTAQLQERGCGGDASHGRLIRQSPVLACWHPAAACAGRTTGSTPEEPITARIGVRSIPAHHHQGEEAAAPAIQYRSRTRRRLQANHRPATQVITGPRAHLHPTSMQYRRNTIEPLLDVQVVVGQHDDPIYAVAMPNRARRRSRSQRRR